MKSRIIDSNNVKGNVNISCWRMGTTQSDAYCMKYNTCLDKVEELKKQSDGK